MSTPTTDSLSPTTSLSATPRTVCSTTASDATTPSPVYVTEAAFIALMDEFTQRLKAVEATNAIIVHEIDEIIADVDELKAA